MKSTRFSCLLSWLQWQSDSFMGEFFFGGGGPFAGFIYLWMVGRHHCRPQSTVHIKQLNFLLLCHDFSLFLGSTSSITRALWCYSRLWYCIKHYEKYTRISRVQFLLQYTISWRDELFMWRWLELQSVSRKYNTWVLCNSNRKWLQNYYSRTVCTI